jgi:hypothetical protein
MGGAEAGEQCRRAPDRRATRHPAAMRRTGDPSGHDLRTGRRTTLLSVLMEQMVTRVLIWSGEERGILYRLLLL